MTTNVVLKVKNTSVQSVHRANCYSTWNPAELRTLFIGLCIIQLRGLSFLRRYLVCSALK